MPSISKRGIPFLDESPSDAMSGLVDFNPGKRKLQRDVSISSEDMNNSADYLSEYELERLENIRRNHDMIRQLGLNEIKGFIQDDIKTECARKTERRRYSRFSLPNAVITERRLSRRIRGENPALVDENVLIEEKSVSDMDQTKPEVRYVHRLWLGKHRQMQNIAFQIPESISVPFTLCSIGTTIWELGAINVDTEELSYWSSDQCIFKHPYPIGYRATKNHFGKNFIMSISKGNGGPLFQVQQENGPTWKGGLILFSKEFVPLRGQPVNSLVRNVLIEDKVKDIFTEDQYALQWSIDNSHDLVLVAVYQKALSLGYIQKLLSSVKSSFISQFSLILKSNEELFDFSAFSTIFESLLSECEASEAGSFSQQLKRPLSSPAGSASISNATMSTSNVASPQPSNKKEDVFANVHKSPISPKTTASPKLKATSPKDGAAKSPRTWDGAQGTKNDLGSLDYSRSPGSSSSSTTLPTANLFDESIVQKQRDHENQYIVPDIDYKEDNSDDDLERMDSAENEPAGKTDVVEKRMPSSLNVIPRDNRIMSLFKSLTSQTVLDDAALNPILEKVRQLLLSKNVAAEVAGTLTESLRSSLLGQKISTFSGAQKQVRKALEISLTKILTPRQSTDLLRDIQHVSREETRPYVIVFCGVNGVGKSTNLSKVCFWLLQNQLKVLIAACDTFRAGAVEQLRVHVRHLQKLEIGIKQEKAVVELYEKGYGKDAAAIARDAISMARTGGYDVVLVDTAGRMQDNEPLMRSLAKLVNMNSPDKIFFVGEALVGNDAVDQVVKFNQSMKDFSDTHSARQIDGIILTKFDTIDDKVGAAVSMSYITGQPIYFVGTGQTYTDLRKLNVKAVVQSLIK